MAGLDSRYVLAYHFEQYFVDKLTGAPLNGEVNFFRDSSRLVPKDVFILSGSPPLYTYVNIGPTVSIANGVPTYNNDNIAIYFFPFFGAPIDNSTVVDLYYYSVENSNGDEQFTREAQPNVFAGSDNQIVDVNYVPNGQFQLHNNLPQTYIAPIYQAGQIRQAFTLIAPGGWIFERSVGSVATDLVTFDQELPVLAIDQSPRYVIHLITSTSGDSKKDLGVGFDDVNKFASTTQEYTFGFTGKTDTGTSNVSLILIKNYGTGGSTTTETVLHTFQVTSTYTAQSFAFKFGDNSAKTIGVNNNDYVELALRHTQDSNYNVFYSDFLLTLGDVQNPVFPPTINNEFQSLSLAGNILSSVSPFPSNPDYNGFDLYLPIRLFADGFFYDSSEIGDVNFETQTNLYDPTTGLHPTTNRLLPVGIQYETQGYAPLGIPFARLQAKYWIASILMPRFGTGSSFSCVTQPVALTANILLMNNSAGAVTNTADGSAATGFTFATIHKQTTSYFTKSYLNAASRFYLENLNPGAVTAIAAGTSGFTVATVRTGDSILPQISSVTTATIANNPGNPGVYFTFQSYNGGALSFYVWYQVSTETDPAPGGTAIKINLVNGDTAAIIAQKTRQALNGWQETLITTTAASTLSPGDFFTFTSISPAAVTQGYYVWYTIDSVGTDPAPVGRIGIKVNVASADTANAVAIATQTAINMKYFSSPDFRGMFLRGWDNGAGNDPTAAERWSLVPGVIGDVIGTFQLDNNLEHSHSTTAGGAVVIASAGATNVTLFVAGATGMSGGEDARPFNANVNYSIKY